MDLRFRLSTADDGDAESLERLAARAGTDAPRGPVMLAEVDGEPIAAVALADGGEVADPERSSSTILTYLHLRRFEARVLGALWV